MKVTLTPDDLFTLTVGTTTFKNMRKISEWNGFLELKNDLGTIAIVAPTTGPPTGPFKKAVRSAINPDQSADWLLVKGSADILAATATD